MTLPDVLEALAVRLPGRIAFTSNDGGGFYEAYWQGDWRYIYWLADGESAWEDDYSRLIFRAALEQECEARGWGISQKIWNDGSGITTVNVFVPGCPYLPSSKGDTPVEALCLALLDALEAQ